MQIPLLSLASAQDEQGGTLSFLVCLNADGTNGFQILPSSTQLLPIALGITRLRTKPSDSLLSDLASVYSGMFPLHEMVGESTPAFVRKIVFRVLCLHLQTPRNCGYKQLPLKSNWEGSPVRPLRKADQLDSP